jgi:outer membrane protein OmpA-like peptidoglycan-associated protein
VTLRNGILVCAGLAVCSTLGSATLAQAPAASKQPQFTTLKADFVPGEKAIFFDDFTDMTAGDPPLRFKSRGAAPELRASGDVRQLTAVASGSLFPNLTALPQNFTYEAEVKFDVPNGIARVFLVLYSKDREAAAWSTFVRSNAMDITVSRKLPKFEELGRTPVKLAIAQPVKMALWVQNGRLRIFMNGDKLLDVNQVDLPPIDRVEIRNDITGAGPSIGYRQVRFAESTPDASDAILASGRYVTHGILFDTDSDRLKPESAYVIQSVAKVLTTRSDLRLLIEGHTDGVGNAAHNMDLSKRRAEAVKSVLVAQFNIDPVRLTTAGLGATKPIDTNDTPLGRAQNRRVEFAKQ